jgi:hypothetical protein
VVSTGSYSVTVTSSAGCSSTSTTAASLTSNPLPAATVNSVGPTVFCSGNSVILNANNGPNYTYQWQLNGANIAGATNASYTATAGGNYTVLVTNNTLNGCTATSSAVYLTENPTPTAIITAAGPTTFCAGGYVVLNTNSATGQTHQWLQNGVGIPGAVNPYIYATSSGNYTVINTEGNCSATSPVVSVTVNPLPVDTILVYGPPIVCSGSNLLLQTQVVAGQTYQWLLNGFNIQGAIGFSYSATQAGQYSVAISDNGCTTYATPVNVTVAPAPNPVITFSVGASGVTLHVPPIYVTYQWLYNNYYINGATGPNVVATQVGAYSVIVTDVNGCSGQAAVFNVYDITGVGNVATHENIKIYPNPATSVVNIDAPVSVNVSISGLDGKVVLFQNDAHNIDISHLANGVYMIKVYDKNNTMLKVDKLIKNDN